MAISKSEIDEYVNLLTGNKGYTPEEFRRISELEAKAFADPDRSKIAEIARLVKERKEAEAPTNAVATPGMAVPTQTASAPPPAGPSSQSAPAGGVPTPTNAKSPAPPAGPPPVPPPAPPAPPPPPPPSSPPSGGVPTNMNPGDIMGPPPDSRPPNRKYRTHYDGALGFDEADDDTKHDRIGKLQDRMKVVAAAGGPRASEHDIASIMGDKMPIGMLAQEANRRAGMVGEGVGDIGRGIGSERAGHIAGGIFGGMGKIGDAFGTGTPLDAMNPVSAPIKFIAAIGEGVEKLRDWNDKLHEANMKFAEFSASMARVQAEQQMRDIQLSQERGERRAESAQRLAEARHRLNRNLAPIEDAFANLKNNLTADLLGPLNRLIERLLGESGEVGEGFTLNETMGGIASMGWMASYGLPPWLEERRP